MKYSILTFALSLSIAGGAISEDIDFIGDYVHYNDQTKIAYLSGNVEIRTSYGYFYTEKVTYNVATKVLFVDGQFNGTLSTGEKVIAKYAQLDQNTQRIISDYLIAMITGGVQFTTTHIVQDDQAVYAENVLGSNCKVCSGSDVPVWQVRAQQIYENLGTQKVYIRNGNLDLFGVPIIWFPFMRIPSPTAGRMDGFLPFTLIVTDGDLTGFKAPYYVPFGEYADVTITPYFTTTDIQMMEFQYRQNIQGLEWRTDGIYVLDDGKGKSNRYALRNFGNVHLPNNVGGSYTYAIRSDYDVYADVSYGRPRYDNFELHKYTNDSWFVGEWRQYLPTSEFGAKTADFPDVSPQITLHADNAISNIGNLSTEVGFLHLDNDFSQDVSRLNANLALNSVNFSSPGLLYLSSLGVDVATYDITKNPDNAKNGEATRITPYANFDVKLPLMKQVGKTSHLITPRIMATWSQNHTSGVALPNLDAHFAERDYVNLFQPNPYIGKDRYAEGLRMSIGTSYAIQGFGQGENFEIGIGSVWRDTPLEGTSTKNIEQFDNLVGYINYDYPGNWSIYSRWALDKSYQFKSVETEMSYLNPKSYFAMNWVMLAPEPEYGFKEKRSEIGLSGRYLIHPNWDLGYYVRYDTVLREPFDANISLTYGNECIEVLGKVSWLFPHGTAAETVTRYEFQIDLLGISKPRTDKWAKKQCTY